MPTYQYECSACSHEFEAFQSMLDKKLKKCPVCRKLKLHRLIGTGSGIIFRGAGFYETDYKNKSKKPVEESSNKKESGVNKGSTPKEKKGNEKKESVPSN